MTEEIAHAAALASMLTVGVFCLFVIGAVLIHEWRRRKAGRPLNVISLMAYRRAIEERARQDRKAARR